VPTIGATRLPVLFREVGAISVAGLLLVPL